jgi:hypothetical protein
LRITECSSQNDKTKNVLFLKGGDCRAEAKKTIKTKPIEDIMKIRSSHGIAFVLAGLVLAVHAQEVQYPTILQQPVDQCVPLGGTASYSVVASNATGYQWLFNGVTMDGQTNSSVTVSNVDLSSVGYYSTFVFNGGDSVPTRSAALDVYASGTTSSGSTSPLRAGSTLSMSTLLGPNGPNGPSTVVYGFPVQSSGGNGNCPGKYSGYVNYIPPSGWGFIPIAPVYSATDTNQTTTKAYYMGAYGDTGCGQTTVTIQNLMSPQYRFSIYFPSGSQVPTNAYPIVLNGF